MAEKNVLANPAPLGLMGFGMTTVLLNIHNAGLFALGSMILAMGIFYGGMAQVIAGVLEYKKGNTFGVTAFSSYGLFWLSLVGVIVIPNIMPVATPDSTALAAYFFMWGLFTFMMFISTLKKNKALQFVFISLAILFWLLTLSELTGNANITIIAGYEGIICGLSAVYLAMAEVINETYGKTILPIGTPTIK
ncbi:MAG: acetate uptake transporter [Petrotogales bacterium]